MNNLTIGFDVYGTLVDPLEMSQYLNSLIGEKANEFAVVWRQKQLEYTFRRGLMQSYQNFDVCTEQALKFAMQVLDVEIENENQSNLLSLYTKLQPFPDVVPALKKLKQSDCILVAFSNGVESTLKTLLSNANLLDYLEDIVSVDALRTFKPNPKFYEYLAIQTKSKLSNCWVVSSNPFDVIGGKYAGINAAWIQRSYQNIFDPWEYNPDITANNLLEFCKVLGEE